MTQAQPTEPLVCCRFGSSVDTPHYDSPSDWEREIILYFSVVDFGSSVDTPLYDSPSDWEREIILYFSVVDFGSSVDTPLFDSPSDWEREINRCRCSHKWWVTDVNAGYQMSTR